MSNPKSLEKGFVNLAFLDVQVSPVTLKECVDIISRKIKNGENYLILGQNLHSSYLNQWQSDFRECYSKADLILADGFPIMAQANIQGLWKSKNQTERIGSTDWLPIVIKQVSIPKVAVVGGSILTSEAFWSWILSLQPSCEILAIPAPKYDRIQGKSIATDLRNFEPNLTIVGLGMPLQEEFIYEFKTEILGVIAAVGGALDQMTGQQINAPRWLGRIGLEWLWRLVSQPRRLAKRYLVEPWLLLVRIFVKRMG